jgi:hypothetical protein
VSPDAAGAARVGVLAPWWALVVLILTPIVAAAGSDRGARRARVWWTGAVGIVPWLPIPHAPALLLPQGPLIWAVLVATLAVTMWPWVRSGTDCRRAGPALHMVAAVSIAFVCYVAAASRMAPVLPGGDEPHYLIITQSLLHDRDLAIENNHRNREYLAYFTQPMMPDFLRRGIDGAIYSIHAPGLPAIVAPAFAAAGYPGVVALLAALAALGTAFVWRAAWRVTGDAGAAWIGWAAVSLSAPFFFQAFTVFPDGLGAVTVMVAVYALVPVVRPGSEGAGAHAGLAGLKSRPTSGCSAPREAHVTPAPDAEDRFIERDCGPHATTRSVGRDFSPAGSASALRFTHAECFAYGTALALLPWLHTRFSILAGVLGVLLMLRLWQDTRSMARVAAFAAIPVASLALWLSYFYALYGTPNPAAPYGGYTQSSLSNAARGISGLLIDQQFGLLPNAPVYLVAVIGIAWLWRAHRRFAIELALIVIPYAVAAASYHMWWGGRSTPARFIVPVLLPFGVAIGVAWQRAGRGVRAMILVLLASSLGITAILAVVDGGALAYNVRDGYALWLEWIAPVVRLPLALPSLFRSGGALATAWAQAAAWVLAIAGGGIVLRRSATVAVPSVTALAIGLGSTAGWMLAGIDAVDAGSGLWRVARAAARPGAVGVTLPSIRAAGAAALLRDTARPAQAPRLDGPLSLFAARDVPAGIYDIRLPTRTGDGSVGVTVGRVPPFATVAVSAVGGTNTIMRHDLPFGAASLRMDSLAHRVVPSGSAMLVPIRLARARVPMARAAVRFDRGTMWVLDKGGWAEGGGVWTRGTAPVTIAADVNGPVPLRLRSGAVPTTVSVNAESWRGEVALGPRDARDIDVPVGVPRTPIRIAADRPFRPHDYDASSNDMRELGVWVELR